MTTQHRFQEWINIALGIWLFVSPFFGFGDVQSAAAWNGYIFGVAIVLLSGTAIVLSHIWEEWINMAIGLWLFVAPFVLGFSNQHDVMLNNMNVGVALLGVSIWASTMFPLHAHGKHISHVHEV